MAIVDTGLNLQDERFASHLCLEGHKDLTLNGIEDAESHGTHVAGLIQQTVGSGNYCFIIYKFYHNEKTKGSSLNAAEAFRLAVKENVKFVNFSAGGPTFSNEEYFIIASHPEVTFIVAAGNDGMLIDKEHTYYPASYNLANILVVGSINRDGSRAQSSNYGPLVTSWEVGVSLLSTIPNGKTGYMSGTSMAAAVRTGKLVKAYLHSH